jgi:uncharacterized membrane protein
MQLQQTQLYLLVLAIISFIVVAALGGGLFSQQSHWVLQWQHQAFFNFCHQIPDRSFWINGQPMAVCSRCFGIYAGFGLSWAALPLWSWLKISKQFPVKKIALAAVLINFFDIIGNILGFWENTLVSRLALGWLIGWTAVLLFSDDFFKSIIK